MASTQARRGTRKAPSPAAPKTNRAAARGNPASDHEAVGRPLDPALLKEFARLAQRELRQADHSVARRLMAGGDVWASGHDPETIPTLAVALACVAAADQENGEEGSGQEQRPFVFLSPEVELLRARQQRFGARAHTWLIDAEGAPEAVEATLKAISESGRSSKGAKGASGNGVVWCTLESLRLASVRDCLARRRPRALLVESAHAASPRAHEMRPSLALVPALRAACGDPPVLAFSRSASIAVREDAAARLGLVNPQLECVPLLAESTRLTVFSRARGRPGERSAQEIPELAELVERLPRPTIVLCPTPQQADAVFGDLSAAQVPVHRYHGGMSVTERATEMLHFTLPGRRAVMVATSAFRPDSGLAGVDAGDTAMPEGLGLGFVKQRARSLVHFGAPASLDQYALELALLGGEEETESVLLLEPEQIELNRELLDQLRLRGDEVDGLASALSKAKGPLDASALEALTGLRRRALHRAARLLADAGVAESTEAGTQRTVSSEALLQVTALITNALGQMRAADQERLGAIHLFLDTNECRRVFLEAYWGVAESELSNCGRCDVCQSAAASARSKKPAPAIEQGMSRRRVPARSWMVAVPQAEPPTVLVQKPRKAASGAGSVR